MAEISQLESRNDLEMKLINNSINGYKRKEEVESSIGINDFERAATLPVYGRELALNLRS